MKRKVISGKSKAPTMPITQMLVAYLLLDKFNCAGWVWGFTGCIYLLICIVVIWSWFLIEPTEVEFKK